MSYRRKDGTFGSTPSERKRMWAAQERKNARTHKHVCDWCPADDIYTCQKPACQHLKKKPCPAHKWVAKRGRAPDDERLEFTPPTAAVDIETHVPGQKYPIISVKIPSLEVNPVTQTVKAVIGEYTDWGSNTVKFDEAGDLVEDEYGVYTVKDPDELMTAINSIPASQLSSLIEDEDGAPYPQSLQELVKKYTGADEI